MDEALGELAGDTNVELPRLKFLKKSSTIASFVNGNTRIFHFISHGSKGSESPLARTDPELLIGDGVDGDMIGNVFGNSESSAICLLVMACHSYNLLKHIPEEKLKNIEHLVLCKGKLSDKESQQFSAGFYCALLHEQLTIASSIRKGFERIGETIKQGERTVGFELIYYSKGLEVDFESIESKKQNQKLK